MIVFCSPSLPFHFVRNPHCYLYILCTKWSCKNSEFQQIQHDVTVSLHLFAHASPRTGSLMWTVFSFSCCSQQNCTFCMLFICSRSIRACYSIKQSLMPSAKFKPVTSFMICFSNLSHGSWMLKVSLHGCQTVLLCCLFAPLHWENGDHGLFLPRVTAIYRCSSGDFHCSPLGSRFHTMQTNT